MSDAGQSILDEALRLPEPERAGIARALLRSLEDDQEVLPALNDAALGAELDRRLQEVVDGTVQTMTVEQAQAFLAGRRRGGGHVERGPEQLLDPLHLHMAKGETQGAWRREDSDDDERQTEQADAVATIQALEGRW
ncbi:addiction module protein [Paraliomyxa miuraensis]|uniref:addiction module protein n=1 Tax=Paraliomyxa miuraensis TaxID=376150 RepID=UPI0022536141|nr:addiction module protein [Paraliomyxa miuraensis]MCX4242542.1 addiction module protein [Paraliomyxa miuraensis]